MKHRELLKGKKYRVELYPTERIVNAIYLGYSDGEHIFSTKLQTEKGYLFLSNYWISIKKEFISHKPISSKPIYFLPEKVKNNENNSKLLKMLETLEQK